MSNNLNNTQKEEVLNKEEIFASKPKISEPWPFPFYPEIPDLFGPCTPNPWWPPIPIDIIKDNNDSGLLEIQENGSFNDDLDLLGNV